MSQKFLISPLIIHCTGGPSQFNKPRKLKKRNEKIKDLERNKNAYLQINKLKMNLETQLDALYINNNYIHTLAIKIEILKGYHLQYRKPSKT